MITAPQWFMIAGGLATLFGLGLFVVALRSLRPATRPAPPARVIDITPRRSFSPVVSSTQVSRTPQRITPYEVSLTPGGQPGGHTLLDRTRIMPRVDTSTRPHGRNAR